MKAAPLIALPLLVALAVPAVVDARTPAAKLAKVKKVTAKRVAVNYADAVPRARIRSGASPDGLTPLEFAKWLGAHPRLAGGTVSIRTISAPTRLLNRVAEHFVEADRNRDGRVSADELADFVQPEPVSALRRASPTT